MNNIETIRHLANGEGLVVVIDPIGIVGLAAHLELAQTTVRNYVTQGTLTWLPEPVMRVSRVPIWDGAEVRAAHAEHMAAQAKRMAR